MCRLIDFDPELLTYNHFEYIPISKNYFINREHESMLGMTLEDDDPIFDDTESLPSLTHVVERSPIYGKPKSSVPSHCLLRRTKTRGKEKGNRNELELNLLIDDILESSANKQESTV